MPGFSRFGQRRLAALILVHRRKLSRERIETLLGFSKEVGAFVAGVSLASTPYRDALGARLVSLRDFLLLFFQLVDFLAPVGGGAPVGREAGEPAVGGLANRWNTPASDPVSLPQANSVEKSVIYFYDVPGAKQSVLRIQRPSLSALDPDYPLANAANFLLGGIYTSQLMTELRVNRGYTYGIRSGFSGAKDRGSFTIGSSVRSNVTRESMALIRDIVRDFGPGFTEEDLQVLKGAVLRGQALKNETLGAKLGVLQNISYFGYPDDYQARDAALVEAMTLDQFREIARKYLRADAMQYLAVGDAETQAHGLGDLGFGEPVMLKSPPGGQ